jgi:hypothetical protein
MLRLKFGWEGEGRFWALHNIIADSDECVLNLEKKFVRSDVATELGMSFEEFDAFIKYLVEDCELLILTSAGVTTNDVQDVLSQVMKKRKKNQSDYQKRTSDPAPTKKPPKATKSSKKKAGKKNQTSEFDTMLEEFQKMRKSIKKPMTPLAVDRLLAKLEKLSSDKATQIKIMDQSIYHCWQDVYALKVDETSVDWKSLTLDQAREMMRDQKMADKLLDKNPELYFKAQQ